jgi:hypothetical protein
MLLFKKSARFKAFWTELFAVTFRYGQGARQDLKLGDLQRTAKSRKGTLINELILPLSERPRMPKAGHITIFDLRLPFTLYCVVFSCFAAPALTLTTGQIGNRLITR